MLKLPSQITQFFNFGSKDKGEVFLWKFFFFNREIRIFLFKLTCERGGKMKTAIILFVLLFFKKGPTNFKKMAIVHVI